MLAVNEARPKPQFGAAAGAADAEAGAATAGRRRQPAAASHAASSQKCSVLQQPRWSSRRAVAFSAAADTSPGVTIV